MLGMKTRVVCCDYAASLEFFTDILGMRLVERFNDEEACILALDSGEQLELVAGRATSTVSLQFETADMQEFTAAIDSALMLGEPELRPWGLYYLYLKEPSGIQLIVYAKATS